ncbi:MAG TPA: phosphatidylglycerophosphatase A, partial [Elusimicrobiota bacterium]|nr:phosphatidylglycerophosphatase A [Elusimicrobiota bacterium]
MELLASCFYLSYWPARRRRGSMRTGAGLIGSLWGLATLPLLPQSAPTGIAVLAVGMLAAVWVSGQAEKIMGKHDDPRIVID